MKKLILIFVALCGTLAAGNFKEEFLREVVKFSETNPLETTESQQLFIQGFYDHPHQQMTGKDVDLRPLYVTAQGDFERALTLFLKEKKVKFVGGVIHTPTPTTPLCTEGEINDTLVDESMKGDQRRLSTVTKRSEIIREYLRNGGKLIVAYPEKGKEKRSTQQLAIFEEAKATFPGITDLPLTVDHLDPEMVGATYFIRTNDGEDFIFAIMARQANAPEDDQTWAIWFGSRESLEIKERLTAFSAYFKPLFFK